MEREREGRADEGSVGSDEERDARRRAREDEDTDRRFEFEQNLMQPRTTPQHPTTYSWCGGWFTRGDGWGRWLDWVAGGVDEERPRIYSYRTKNLGKRQKRKKQKTNHE
jgi:hypothetical protein